MTVVSLEIPVSIAVLDNKNMVALTLVVEKLFSRLGGIFGVGALDNGVNGARLLAEAAVDALGHVNVIAGRTAGTVRTLFGLDGDGLGRADLHNRMRK